MSEKIELTQYVKVKREDLPVWMESVYKLKEGCPEIFLGEIADNDYLISLYNINDEGVLFWICTLIDDDEVDEINNGDMGFKEFIVGHDNVLKESLILKEHTDGIIELMVLKQTDALRLLDPNNLPEDILRVDKDNPVIKTSDVKVERKDELRLTQSIFFEELR